MIPDYHLIYIQLQYLSQNIPHKQYNPKTMNKYTNLYDRATGKVYKLIGLESEIYEQFMRLEHSYQTGYITDLDIELNSNMHNLENQLYQELLNQTNMANRIKSAANRAQKELVTGSDKPVKLDLPMSEVARAIPKVDLGKYSLKENNHYPDDAVTLSVVQEALVNLTGTDILSLSLKLGAKTDIRDTIKEIQIANESNSALIEGLIPQYILDLILAYEVK